jgi:formyltetrahydrofolate hydrolase
VQRVEWELREFAVKREEIAEAFRPIAERFGMAWSLRFSDYTPRLAVFVSKLPHCMYDLLARWRMGEFRAEIALVVSNHRDQRAVAESFGVEFREFDVRSETKGKEESRILELLERQRIDVVVLARYMQVLSPEFVSQYPQHHQHPSLVPAGVCGRPAVPPRARARGEDHRRDGALRDGGAGPRTDHRAGRRAGLSPRLGGRSRSQGAGPGEGCTGTGGGPAPAQPDCGLREQDCRV